MKVTYPQVLSDSCNGVNFKFEVADGGYTMGRIFKKAIFVKVEVDHRFDVQIIHTAKEAQSLVWGLSHCCEMEVALADERYTYYVRNGDILILSSAADGTGQITQETFRDRLPEDDEVDDERVQKVA